MLVLQLLVHLHVEMLMKLQIKVNQSTNIIEDAKFKTFGCGSAIASSSFSTEFIKNKTLDEAIKYF